MAVVAPQDFSMKEMHGATMEGIVEALNKLSSIMNMATRTVANLPLAVLNVSSSDKNRIYKAANGYRVWLENPAPVIKKNGVVIDPVADSFEIDYVGGAIYFDENSRLDDGDAVTADVSYIVDASAIINSLQNAIEAATSSASKYKGVFSTKEQLIATVTTPLQNDYAIISGEMAVAFYDNAEWKNGISILDFNSYYNKNEIDTKLSGKENSITAHGDTSADDAYYYGGRKSWVSAPGVVRQTTLDGLDTSAEGGVVATDTVLGAIGKLQNQASEVGARHFIVGSSNPVESTTGSIGQRYCNVETGECFVCTAIQDGTYTWEPIPTSAQVEGKVDKVEGMGLSQNSFLNWHKNRIEKTILVDFTVPAGTTSQFTFTDSRVTYGHVFTTPMLNGTSLQDSDFPAYSKELGKIIGSKTRDGSFTLYLKDTISVDLQVMAILYLLY